MSENDPQTMTEAYEPETHANAQWGKFVDTALIQFFQENDLEKIMVEDGRGNKVKLSRTKDNEIKVEQSSISIRY